MNDGVRTSLIRPEDYPDPEGGMCSGLRLFRMVADHLLDDLDQLEDRVILLEVGEGLFDLSHPSTANYFDLGDRIGRIRSRCYTCKLFLQGYQELRSLLPSTAQADRTN